LLDAFEEWLVQVGVDDLVLGVLAGNEAAIRLHAIHGYLPIWVCLSKFHGRPRSR